MSITLHDPDVWLETLVRGLHDYAALGFKDSALDDSNNPIGDEIYDIFMEFPPPEKMQQMVPLTKTVIHFEIDDIDTRSMGMGEGAVVDNYDPIEQQNNPQEGREHRVNFDVGIWASDRSGGTTSRLRAYQILSYLFSGTLAIARLREMTKSVDMNLDVEGQLDVLNFQSGRFITDSINDIPVYRMIDCILVIRVFSRTPRQVFVPTMEEIIQDPDLIIDPNLHL